MQRIVAGLMIISMTLLGGNFLVKYPNEVQKLDVLQDAFVASEAALVELAMNGWAKVSSASTDVEELHALINRGAQASFGVEPECIETTDEGGVVIARATFFAEAYYIEASAQSLEDETYLVLTLQTNDKTATVQAVQQRMRQFFQASKLNAKLTTCLIGVISGRLLPESAAALVGEVLAVLQAEMHESYSDGTVTNITGYSRLLPAGVSIGGRVQNISLTMRYNVEDNDTYLWLAWPTFSIPI